MDGGLAPLWSRDGTELFFISPDRTMMSAPVETDPTFRVTAREPLFQIGPEFLIGDRTTQYDVSDDGRFLMIRAIAGTEGASRVVLVRNWFEEIRERVGR